MVDQVDEIVEAIRPFARELIAYQKMYRYPNGHPVMEAIVFLLTKNVDLVEIVQKDVVFATVVFASALHFRIPSDLHSNDWSLVKSTAVEEEVAQWCHGHFRWMGMWPRRSVREYQRLIRQTYNLLV